jgi:hypothetical protein
MSAICRASESLECAYLDLVPILTGEGVHSLLLEALLAL